MESEPVVVAITGPGFRHQLTIETVEDLELWALILESIKKKLTAATLSERNNDANPS